MLKFRSMRPDAEAESGAGVGGAQRSAAHIVWSNHSGFSLDEFPQLINVWSAK